MASDIVAGDLEAYYVLDGFYRMDPKDPEAAKKALEYLKSLA